MTARYGRVNILEKYLNTVYMGNHIYGVQAASEVYFDKKDIAALSPFEITTILTLIHNPSIDPYDPDFRAYFDKIKNRLQYDFDTDTSTLRLRKHVNRDDFPFVTRTIESLCA